MILHPIRVGLVDDDPLVIQAISTLLGSEEDINITATGHDGTAAIRMIRDNKVDVVLLDVQMPGMDGLEAMRRIHDRFKDAPVLMLTTFDADEFLRKALANGAKGFLLKDSHPQEIADAIRKVHTGQSAFSESPINRLINHFTTDNKDTAPSSNSKKLESLSEREREVLELLMEAKSNAEIADTLVLSETTVKSHIRSILKKLDVRDRVEAVVFAFKSGLS